MSVRSAIFVGLGVVMGWAGTRSVLRRRIVVDERLTDRQREIMAMIGRGMSSKQIAREMGLGQRTVDTHIKRARAALGAPTRAAAIATLQADRQAGTPARPRRSAIRPRAVTTSPTSSSNGI